MVNWFDEAYALRNYTFPGVHTAFECSIYMSWYDFYKYVLRKCGISTPEADAWYSRAVQYWGLRDFDSCYSASKNAVIKIREAAEANKSRVAESVKFLHSTIVSKLRKYSEQGIPVSEYYRSVASLESLMTAGSWIMAYKVADSLLGSIESYSTAYISKTIPVNITHCITNVPGQATDYSVITLTPSEGAGWSEYWYASKYFYDKVGALIREVEPTAQLLEVRVEYPRVMIFVKGSPIAPVLAVLLIKVIAAVILAVIALYAIKYITAVFTQGATIAEALARKADAEANTVRELREMAEKGLISKETLEDLLGKYMEKSKQEAEVIKGAEVSPLKLLGSLLILGVGGIIAIEVVRVMMRK